VIVHLRERPPLRPLLRGGVHHDAPRLELLPRTSSELVVPERGEEVRLVGEQRELHGCDAATPAGLLPLVEGVRDLARGRHAVDAREANPLDVPDDCGAHQRTVYHVSHAAPSTRFTR
jgi:hypothetical protein